MTSPNITITMLTMLLIMTLNLITTKTSIMCINLVMYTMLASMIMSMKIKLSPVPFIVFLTMIGGLMIIFLYLAATLWTKKETLTLKTKTMIIMMTSIIILPNKTYSESTLWNNINMFKFNLNKMTISMIILLTIMLIFTIEIHMKANSPFRRKLKIWE